MDSRQSEEMLSSVCSCTQGRLSGLRTLNKEDNFEDFREGRSLDNPTLAAAHPTQSGSHPEPSGLDLSVVSLLLTVLASSPLPVKAA